MVDGIVPLSLLDERSLDKIKKIENKYEINTRLK